MTTAGYARAAASKPVFHDCGRALLGGMVFTDGRPPVRFYGPDPCEIIAARVKRDCENGWYRYKADSAIYQRHGFWPRAERLVPQVFATFVPRSRRCWRQVP